MPRVPQPRQTIGIAPLNTPSPAPVVGQSGTRELAQGIQQVGRVAGTIYRAEQEKVRSARLLDAYAELATTRQEIESTALAQKGKDALQTDLVANTGQLLDNAAGKIAEGFGDRELADRFKKIHVEQRLQLQSTVEHHRATEDRAFQEISFETAAGTAMEDAKRAAILGDPAGAAAALGTLAGAIDAHARGQGWDPSTKARALQDFTSKTHASVVHGLLSGDPANPERAVEYLTHHRAEMKTDEISQVEHAVMTFGTKAKAARVAHEIVQASVDQRNPLRLDPTAAFAALDAKVAAGLVTPSVETEARSLIAQHIKDRAEGAKQALNQVAGDAMGQFMAIGPDGRPRMSFSNVRAETLTRLAAFGEDGQKVIESLVKGDQSNEGHFRSMRQMPTEAESGRAFRIERSLALRPGDWRALNGAQQMAVLSGSAPVPGEPDAPAVPVSSKDVPGLAQKIATLSAPVAPEYVMSPEAIVRTEAEKAFPGLKPKPGVVPPAEAIQTLKDVSTQVAAFIDAEKNRTGKKPSEEEVTAKTRYLLQQVEVRDRLLKWIGGGWETTRRTTRIQAETQGEQVVPATPAPTAKSPARPRRIDPKTGEARVWNGSAWVKE